MRPLPFSSRLQACCSLIAYVCLGLALLPLPAAAQEPSESVAGEGRFVDRVYRDSDGDHKFVVFEPAGYSPAKKWPVIFYLHGASGRGRDGRAQLVVGLGPAVKSRAATLPFLVVFPQNENLRSRLLGGWTDGSNELNRALKILDEVERTYSVDRNHEVLAGVSMGAFGAWSVAADSPNRWKAVIAVSGGGESRFVPALTKVPVWAFHAADDQLVPPSRSSDLVAEINAAGGRAFVSIVPTGGHNIGAAVLARDEVFAWMLHPERAPVTHIDWAKQVATADMLNELPFVPGADVATAARIRVNQDLLQSLSYLAADQIPADALQGWKEGRQEQQPMARTITVGSTHYSGQIERVGITPLPNGQLRVQVGIRNMTMTITDTQVQGLLMSAYAGPISIAIGFREPVWLTADVTPYVVDRRLKLQAAAVYFQIPDDNWSVSRPSVSVAGLPFMQDMIADRLVEGVEEKKSMIEQSIRDSIPQMLEKLEARLNELFGKTVTYREWPMPLWQPRFRFYPESVSIDEGGLQLTLGATVAALAPKSSNVPIRPFPANQEKLPDAATMGLDVAISMRLLNAYSVMLSSSDVARFHVLDLNSAGLRQLGSHEFWNSVLPADRQIDPATELNTEFVLTKPFRVQGASAGSSAQHRLGKTMDLMLPQLQLQLASRGPGERAWTDRAVVNLAFHQQLDFAVEKPGFSQRKMKLDLKPIAVPTVDAGWLAGDGAVPIDTARIATQFQEGWSSNFGKTKRDGRMKDLNLAQLTLRWDEVGSTPTHLVARLRRPGIRLYNSSDKVAEYQVRSKTSSWTQTLRISPGTYHDYDSATPMVWRSGGANGERRYSLPLGFEAAMLKDPSSGQLILYQQDAPR